MNFDFTLSPLIYSFCCEGNLVLFVEVIFLDLLMNKVLQFAEYHIINFKLQFFVWRKPCVAVQVIILSLLTDRVLRFAEYFDESIPNQQKPGLYVW